ncbi:MAG TPA: hypothetical protein VFW15_02810, partial [Thermoanaerobaculia bacterium]|nr:hypothetical protein [Thermoanaerobaculia bacterium]
MRFICALVLLITVGCGTAQQSQSAPTAAAAAAAPTATTAPTPAPSSPAAATLLQNPNQESNDEIARAVAEKIAGRENEPAEKVFRNIQSLKGMPAGRFVRVMNMGYSRA